MILADVALSPAVTRYMVQRWWLLERIGLADELGGIAGMLVSRSVFVQSGAMVISLRVPREDHILLNLDQVSLIERKFNARLRRLMPNEDWMEVRMLAA